MTATRCNSALQLRWELRALARKYQIVPQPNLVPLADPVPYPLIVEGVAATADCDSERLRLAHGALAPLPDCRNLRLLLRHNPAVRVGEIQELHYGNDGTLRIRARVTNPEAARLGAFSAAFKVIESELHDADGPNFFGLVRRAELSEISCTDRPSDPRALVTNRLPAAFSDYWSNASAAVSLIVKALEVQRDAIRQLG